MSELPSSVKRFIDLHLESLAQLEALLLLYGSPQQAWSATELAKTMYVPTESASALLADLARRKLASPVAEVDTRYRFQPADSEAAEAIADLAAIYQERRVAVITQIYSKPLSKVQTFADAFRFGKEK